MTWTLTATPEPTNAPPRVKLEAVEDDPLISLQAVALYRDGLPVRFEPVLSAQSAIAYDYDAPFDSSLTYRADASELNMTPEFAETWGTPSGPPPDDWSGDGWVAASGVATSTAAGAWISRDSLSAITQVEVTAPSNMRLELTADDDVTMVSVWVTPDGMVWVRGTSGATKAVAGSGDYTVSVARDTVSVAGTGWDVQVPFEGAATRVWLGAPDFATYVESYGTSGSGVGQLLAPRGLAFNTAGTHFFVVDSQRAKVLKYTAAGAYVSEFGTAGTASGQMLTPYGIAVDGSDNVWVVDLGNNKILKFDSSGAFVAQYGSAGSGNGQFNKPVDIAFDSSGHPWVTDYGNNRIQELDASGAYVSKFTITGGPNGIAIDASDHLWVTLWDSNLVKEYDTAGALQSTSGYGFDKPNLIAVDDTAGLVYVTDWNNARVVVFDMVVDSSDEFGALGRGPGQFYEANGIAVVGSSVYIADAGPSPTDRVQKWTTEAATVGPVTVMGMGRPTSASSSATATLSPTGEYAGAWLTNAAQPELAILAEKQPASGDDPYFIVATTRESGTLQANSVQLAIEGSADVVTAALGPRMLESWTLNIACTTQAAYKALVALLADMAVVNLRFPDDPRWAGLDGGFYAVGDVGPGRIGHPQLGPVIIVSLPLTPSRAPAYKPLWQWNARTLAQTGMTSRDANLAFPTARAMLVGPG